MIFLQVPRMTAPGANSPFAALHKAGSYRGFTCRAFTVARPVSFDPKQALLGAKDCDAALSGCRACEGAVSISPWCPDPAIATPDAWHRDQAQIASAFCRRRSRLHQSI